MRAAFAVSLLAFAVTSAAARADPAPARDASRMVTDDCARARKAGKTCVLDVPAEDVGGSRPMAGDFSITLVQFDPKGSLIRVRHDFLPEIVQAAEDL